MPETTPLIKAALNLRVGVGFDVYEICTFCLGKKSRDLINMVHDTEERAILYGITEMIKLISLKVYKYFMHLNEE